MLTYVILSLSGDYDLLWNFVNEVPLSLPLIRFFFPERYQKEKDTNNKRKDTNTDGRCSGWPQKKSQAMDCSPLSLSLSVNLCLSTPHSSQPRTLNWHCMKKRLVSRYFWWTISAKREKWYQFITLWKEKKSDPFLFFFVWTKGKSERESGREWVSSLVSRSRLFPDSLKFDKTVLFPFLPFLHPSPPPVNDCFTILSSVSFLRFTHHSIFVTLGCCLFCCIKEANWTTLFFIFQIWPNCPFGLFHVQTGHGSYLYRLTSVLPVIFRNKPFFSSFLDETWNGQKSRFLRILFWLDTNKLKDPRKALLKKVTLPSVRLWEQPSGERKNWEGKEKKGIRRRW